jgi:hypothetical protein
MRQITVEEKGVQAIEAGQGDEQPAGGAEEATRRLARSEPAENDQEDDRAEKTEKDSAHARLEWQLFATHEHAVRRPLRRNAVQQFA